MTQPPNMQSLQQALQHHRAGRLADAEKIYREILASSPNDANALQLLGSLVGQAGHFEEAVGLLRRAIALHPNVAALHSNLGEFYRRWGQLDQALAAFQKAIDLDPNSADAHNNLGITLNAQGSGDQAIAAFQKAIALKANYPEAHNNLGAALRDQARPEEAVAALRNAIAMRPDYAEAYHNLGNTFRELHRLDDSLAALQRSVALRPNFADAHASLAVILRDLGLLDESIAACRRALVLRPDYSQAHSNLILMLHYAPDPHPGELLAESRDWQRRHAAPFENSIPSHSNTRELDRPLRIGYVSPDFNQHSVAFFLLPLLENHDKARFITTCYYNGQKSDAITSRIRRAAANWRDLASLSDDQFAGQIQSDQIDILVDLAGHTAHNRLLVFARKPAPLQLTYLGFPGTTGLDAMDYRLTDALADPDPAAADHTEQLLRLQPSAWCFAPLSGSPDIKPLPALANGHITFGTFNHIAKITPASLDLWAQILQQLPSSRLLLKNMALATPSVAARLRGFFAQRNISPARLQLLPPESSVLHHLERYQQVDIALDTFPYHGTTTTCEALWMGVPVVTLAGSSHASRVGVSLLTNVGLPELVARSPSQYAAVALKLANDLPALADLRSNLRPRMQASPLMDPAHFAADVESTYRRIWKNWCATPRS